MSREVMVVDDEADMRQLISLTLLRHGYAVLEASSGLLALDAIAKKAPDLVILDVMMPGLSGIQVIRQLKRNPDTTSIPVIMLSAKAQEEDIVAMLQSGADACLIKPFSLTDLVQGVEVLLGFDPGSNGE